MNITMSKPASIGKKKESKPEINPIQRGIREGEFIIKPNQYDLLMMYPKNRPINSVHVMKMKLSVQKHNILRNVIVVWDEKKKKYYIVDGQHLFTAIMELNLEIRCHAIPCDDENQITQLMIDLNNTSKSWKMMDFINGWAESGNKAYRTLRNAANVTYADVQSSVIIQAYTQKNRQTATKMVKEGTFQIVDKTKGDEFIDCISECSELVPNTRQMNEALIKLMIKTKSYDHKHMVRRLKSVGKFSIFSTNESELYKQLVKIYNS